MLKQKCGMTKKSIMVCYSIFCSGQYDDGGRSQK